MKDNPVRQVKLFREDNKPDRWLSLEEEAVLLSKRDEQLREFGGAAVDTGFRAGKSGSEAGQGCGAPHGPPHFISRLVLAGVDIRTVQELAGHKAITMTMRYSRLAVDLLEGNTGREVTAGVATVSFQQAQASAVINAR